MKRKRGEERERERGREGREYKEFKGECGLWEV
jgi:hypothetical protein